MLISYGLVFQYLISAKLYSDEMSLQMSAAQQSIDGSINIICLSLQYSFAERYYDKYCGCLRIFCQRIFKSKIRSVDEKNIVMDIIVDDSQLQD